MRLILDEENARNDETGDALTIYISLSTSLMIDASPVSDSVVNDSLSFLSRFLRRNNIMRTIPMECK